MPLDVTGLAPETVELSLSLDTRCRAVGITPVSEAILMHHKRAQEALHPASRLFPYAVALTEVVQALALVAVITFMGAGALTMCALVDGLIWLLSPSSPMILPLIWPAATAIASFATLRLLFEASKRALLGPAYWRVETTILGGVPEPIRDVAYELQARFGMHGPRIRFYTHKLFQNVHEIDPYLTVRDLKTGEEVVLGIWEGEQIIAIADLD